MARDLKTHALVALKIQKSAIHYFDAAFDEIEILNKVNDNKTNIKWSIIRAK